jgi:hypothetical protein
MSPVGACRARTALTSSRGKPVLAATSPAVIQGMATLLIRTSNTAASIRPSSVPSSITSHHFGSPVDAAPD